MVRLSMWSRVRGLGTFGREFFRGSGRIEISRAMKFFRHFVGSFLKFLDALTEAFGEFGQFFCAEQKKDDCKNQDQFHSAHVEQSKNRIHKATLIFLRWNFVFDGFVVAHSFFKLFDALSDASGQSRQFSGAEQEDHYCEDQNDLHAPHVE